MTAVSKPFYQKSIQEHYSCSRHIRIINAGSNINPNQIRSIDQNSLLFKLKLLTSILKRSVNEVNKNKNEGSG